VDLISMAPYFPTMQKRFYENPDPEIKKDIAAAVQPYPKEDPDGMPGNIIYPNDVHVYKQTAEDPERFEAVKKFMAFVNRPDVAAIMTCGQEPGGFYPATEAGVAPDAPMWEDPVISFYPEFNKVAVETVRTGKLYSFEFGKCVNLAIGDISGALVFADVVQKIVSGAMSVEDAVAWGHKEMEKYL